MHADDATNTVVRISPGRPTRAESNTAFCVRDLVCARVVKVPAWFTATQAIRIAELRNVEHLLVEDPGGICGSIGRTELAALPGAQPIGRAVHRGDAVVAADAPVVEAQRLMNVNGLSCLPVVAGGMLVGTISRADIDAALPRSAEAA